VVITIITPFFPFAGVLSYFYSYLFIKILNLRYLAFAFAPGILA